MELKATAVVISSDKPFRSAVREELSNLSSAELIGEADDIRSGHELLLKAQPDVIFLDLPRNAEDSLRAATQWKTEFPGVQIFAVSASKNPDLILAAMRAGASEYLSKPLEVKELKTALDKALRELERGVAHSGRTGRVIAVFSKKGGLGVTTIAVNLAVALASGSDRRTALVDMAFDLGDVASLLDMTPRFAVSEVLDKSGNIDAGSLESSLIRHTSGIYYLGEREMAGEPEQISPEQVHQILSHLKDAFHYTILDLPHTFDTHNYEALQIADHILLVATCDMSAIRATRYTLKTFRSLGYNQDKVQLLLNRVSKKDAITPDQFASTLEYPVTHIIANDYRSVIESINTGEPLVSQKPKSEVARKIRQVAERLGSSQDSEARGNDRSLFRKLLGSN